MFEKENLKYYLFLLLATLYVGIAFTSADFFTAPFFNMKDAFILFLQWGILMVALFSVIYLLSINKYIFSVIYPIIVIFSSVLMYFRYTTGTILTTMILDVTFDNDSKITGELLSSQLVMTVIFATLISFLFLYIRLKKIILRQPILHLGIAFILFLIIFNIPRFKNPLRERIPFNLYFMTSRYFAEKKEAFTDRKELGPIYSCGEEEEKNDLMVLFVLGESLRADHLGINGYERNTTPFLSREDVISFTNIYSHYTYTNASVAHIMTRADSVHPDLRYKERSFIDLFKQCNYYSSWLANQEPAKSYIYFMKECDNLVFNNINKSSYVFDKWLDEDLLADFELLLERKNEKQLIIMHTIGSHWYYNSHFPDEFQVYNPITKSRIVNSNMAQEIINSYDNTILYTDYFISQVINLIREKNVIMIYLSDHGEALGEEGVWLHASDSAPIHHPACFVWMSDRYKINNPEKYKSAINNKEKYYRTDFLFPSILDAADIKSEIIDLSLSIFR